MFQRYSLVVLLAGAALLGLMPMPYGFYVLSRVVNVVVFGILAHRLRTTGIQVWGIALGFLIVYNPIIPIHLGSKALWALVNFAGVAFAFIATRRSLSITSGNRNKIKNEGNSPKNGDESTFIK